MTTIEKGWPWKATALPRRHDWVRDALSLKRLPEQVPTNPKHADQAGKCEPGRPMARANAAKDDADFPRIIGAYKRPNAEDEPR